MKNIELKLGVNIDHIATLRQARGGVEPDLPSAAELAVNAGADSITVHLREDRRHIQDDDVVRLRNDLDLVLNLEMAATDEMLNIAETIVPDYSCIVPEKRIELTTEGGLDVINNTSKLKHACDRLRAKHILSSLFIDPDISQIDAAHDVGADAIEIHTGHYANSAKPDNELDEIISAAEYASKIGLQVNAGHGLTTNNVAPVAKILQISELNIGHSIVSHAIFIGLEHAIKEIKTIMINAR